MNELGNIVERKPIRKGLNPAFDSDVESVKTYDKKTGEYGFYQRTINWVNRKTGECKITDWYPIKEEFYNLE